MKDYNEMLKKDIDIVAVATPVDTHFKFSKMALDAGKHIICEKNMTLNTEQALALSKAVKKTNFVFQVCYQWQSIPLFNKIHEINPQVRNQ